MAGAGRQRSLFARPVAVGLHGAGGPAMLPPGRHSRRHACVGLLPGSEVVPST